MSKENKSAGPFDLNRDGKLSMTEHYIAYKTFEEMAKTPSYTPPRPRRKQQRWWNEPIDLGPEDNVPLYIILSIIHNLVPAMGIFMLALDRKDHISRGLSTDGSGGAIAILAIWQILALVMSYVVIEEAIEKRRKYRREKREREEEERRRDS